MSDTHYLQVSKIKDIRLRRFVIVLTLPFLILLNCFFVVILAIKQIYHANAKTIKTAIKQSK